MLTVHYTQRLIDNLSISSGNLQTDIIDILLNSKKLSTKVQDIQQKILRFKDDYLSKISNWISQFTKQTSTKPNIQQQQLKNKQIIEAKRKQIQNKILLIQVRNLLKTKARKMKIDLNKSYKSLSHKQQTQQEDTIDKLNTSIRMMEKDLGIQEEEGEGYESRRSYITQHTLQSIQKEQTIGNESVLSIENVVRKHQFILDTEIKRDVYSEERSVVMNNFSISSIQNSNSIDKREQRTQSKQKQKQQNSKISNKVSVTKVKTTKPSLIPSSLSSSSKKPPINPSKSSKQSARIQQIKNNLMKYKQDLQQQQPIQPPVSAIKQERQVIFSKTKSRGTFDDAIKQSYEELVKQDFKR